MLKKITRIFSLSIIIVLLGAGSHFIHSCFLKSNVLTNKQNLQSTEIIIINSNELHINSQNITWAYNNEALDHKGILYDILSIQHEQEKTILTLFTDVEEEENKHKLAENYDEDSDKSLKLLKQFLTLQYISPTTESFKPFPVSSILVDYKDHPFIISSGFLSQETPPPNFSI